MSLLFLVASSDDKPPGRWPPGEVPDFASPDEGDEVVVEERKETRTPRRYKILLHNDDFTTMDFVIDVLMRFFHKSNTEATRIMFMVHNQGSAVAGVYTFDVAETKVAQVTKYARENGHPLLCSMEPV